MKHLVPIALCATLSGCEGPDVFEGLARGLVPSGAEGYERDGRLLKTGSFTDLSVETTPPSFDFALAIDDDGGLLVASITAGSDCRLRDVTSYQPAVWSSFEFDEASLPFVREMGGEPTLLFSSFACEIADVRIPSGRVADYVPLFGDAGILVEDASGNVFAVNPWLETQRELGRRVLSESHPLRHSVLVQDGELVLYDASAEPLLTIGSDVVEAVVLAASNEVLFSTENGALFAVRLDDVGPEVDLLDEDACQLIDAGAEGHLAAYFSPCDSQRLKLYIPNSAGGLGQLTELSEGVQRPRIVTRSTELESQVEASALSVVFFRNYDEDADSGELWTQTAGREPRLLETDVRDSWMLPAFDPGENAVVAFVLKSEPNTDRLDLVATDGTNRVPLARSVLALFESTGSLVLVADGDEEAGDLLLVESRPFDDLVLREPPLLLTNVLAGLELTKVPVLRNVVGNDDVRVEQGIDRLSLYRTLDDTDSRLFVTRQSRLDGSFADPVLVTKRAGTQYRFSLNFESSVLSLVESGGEAFQLRHFFFDSDAETTIADHVVEFYESTVAGREGVLYATGGETPGLYYASVR